MVIGRLRASVFGAITGACSAAGGYLVAVQYGVAVFAADTMATRAALAAAIGGIVSPTFAHNLGLWWSRRRGRRSVLAAGVLVLAAGIAITMVRTDPAAAQTGTWGVEAGPCTFGLGGRTLDDPSGGWFVQVGDQPSVTIDTTGRVWRVDGRTGETIGPGEVWAFPSLDLDVTVDRSAMHPDAGDEQSFRGVVTGYPVAVSGTPASSDDLERFGTLIGADLDPTDIPPGVTHIPLDRAGGLASALGYLQRTGEPRVDIFESGTGTRNRSFPDMIDVVYDNGGAGLVGGGLHVIVVEVQSISPFFVSVLDNSFSCSYSIVVWVPVLDGTQGGSAAWFNDPAGALRGIWERLTTADPDGNPLDNPYGLASGGLSIAGLVANLVHLISIFRSSQGGLPTAGRPAAPQPNTPPPTAPSAAPTAAPAPGPQPRPAIRPSPVPPPPTEEVSTWDLWWEENLKSVDELTEAVTSLPGKISDGIGRSVDQLGRDIGQLSREPLGDTVKGVSSATFEQGANLLFGGFAGSGEAAGELWDGVRNDTGQTFRDLADATVAALYEGLGIKGIVDSQDTESTTTDRVGNFLTVFVTLVSMRGDLRALRIDTKAHTLVNSMRPKTGQLRGAAEAARNTAENAADFAKNRESWDRANKLAEGRASRFARTEPGSVPERDIMLEALKESPGTLAHKRLMTGPPDVRQRYIDVRIRFDNDLTDGMASAAAPGGPLTKVEDLFGDDIPAATRERAGKWNVSAYRTEGGDLVEVYSPSGSRLPGNDIDKTVVIHRADGSLVEPSTAEINRFADEALDGMGVSQTRHQLRIEGNGPDSPEIMSGKFINPRPGDAPPTVPESRQFGGVTQHKANDPGGGGNLSGSLNEQQRQMGKQVNRATATASNLDSSAARSVGAPSPAQLVAAEIDAMPNLAPHVKDHMLAVIGQSNPERIRDMVAQLEALADLPPQHPRFREALIAKNLLLTQLAAESGGGQ